MLKETFRAVRKRFRSLIARVQKYFELRRNKSSPAATVFTEIYETNRWGGEQGEFCSGAGSVHSPIVDAYIGLIHRESISEGFQDMRFVDLGCGDFRVGQSILPFCSSYIGVDVVAPLIEHNQREFGNEVTEFKCLDISESDLPEGDVCFIRQVLQHLSNAEISRILKKLDRYKWVYITEHYPSNGQLREPNIDIVHGGDVRVYSNSGVCLSEAPFDLLAEKLETVLTAPGAGLSNHHDPGVISTIRYKP